MNRQFQHQAIIWLTACFLSLVSISTCTHALPSQAQSEQSQTDVVTQADAALTAEQQAYRTWAQGLWESMHPQDGLISLANGAASLNVPDGFYFLSSDDAHKVLVEIWGNPDASSQGVLGMLFPAHSNPFDNDSWGVTIEYEQEGYVKDDDAADIDYDDLLSEMKGDTRVSSEQRVEMGYEPIELVGWAAQPFYDTQTKKLYWAKEIRFGDAPLNTLNYNIRVLGRKGVLVLNFIAGMDQLEEINQNLDTVLNIAEFENGSRYADFDPDIDEVAAYGLGALVAGKVLMKTGFLAAALIFLKKFGVIILIGAGALVKKLWSSRKMKSQD